MSTTCCATSSGPTTADWDDERIYQTARLIVSALIAKIHTVEWTPAILGTEVIDIGLKTNWNGPRPNDWLTRLGIWLIDSHAQRGHPEDHAGPQTACRTR